MKSDLPKFKFRAFFFLNKVTLYLQHSELGSYSRTESSQSHYPISLPNSAMLSGKAVLSEPLDICRRKKGTLESPGMLVQSCFLCLLKGAWMSTAQVSPAAAPDLTFPGSGTEKPICPTEKQMGILHRLALSSVSKACRRMWLARTARHLEKGFPEAFAAKPQAKETISGLCFLFIMQTLTATRRRRKAVPHHEHSSFS